MRLAFCAILFAFTGLALAGSMELERPLPVSSYDNVLQYDDGTAWWISWDGTYRGVWFNVEDFFPGGGPQWLSDESELWFYHHSSYPWDTASFYCHLFDGGVGGPVNQQNQTSVTALHYAPCYADYSYPIVCDTEFWIIVNTEMSTGGWPSTLGDNTPQTVSHSFYSENLYTQWMPWEKQGPTANDYFIRSSGACSGLTPATWGAIKSLF